ncbi:MAG TPA: VIT1/CCC1 transporter family protein [Gammaproteobacteria bacterium]
MAAIEPDPRKRRLFESLARAAEDQAEVWARRLDGGPPVFRAPVRVQLVAALARRLGVRRLRPALVAMKFRGLSVYDSADPAGHVMPTRVEQVGASHRGLGGGGTLRAAVFGVNDGLVSNASLILGVSGAGVDSGYVLTAGVAGLLAGALSMAAGEYVSVRSQREMFEYQIGLEREELEEYPDEEAEELALIYEARGMELGRARELARDLLKNPQHALDTLAREELGLNPDDLGSPWTAAGSSFGAFAAGAAVPLLPFLLHLDDGGTLKLTIALTALSLFGVGMVLSLFSGRSAIQGGLRMLAIGGGAGLATWLIGSLIGGSLN